MTRRSLEIESLTAFDRHVASARTLNGWFVSSLDLSGRSAELRQADPRGAVFLGCEFQPGVEHDLRDAGALIFPRLPDLPFDPYRSSLYDAVELYGAVELHGAVEYGAVEYGADDYASSLDARIYAWSRSPGASRSVPDTLAAALHDHAISDALDDTLVTLDSRAVVGVMGGHALLRGEDGYRAAASLGLQLGLGGKVVVTGGGPGAMEAANLGAYLSSWPDRLDQVGVNLAAVPSFRPSIDAWAQAAFAVRQRCPADQAGTSLSIPTWFYGHEPSNVFATQIAKYFTNALREDTLLHRCRGGIVYLPGQAGTVQEIFQAVTENFYAADTSQLAPMILVGVDYWTHVLPAWPLLQRMASDRPMGAALSCVDTVDAAVGLLLV